MFSLLCYVTFTFQCEHYNVTESLFFYLLCPWRLPLKVLAYFSLIAEIFSMYCQTAQNQPKSQLLLYKNGSPSINQLNLAPTNILEPFCILFANCSFFKKGLITFHFSENMFSFSKWVSEWALIFKMSFFLKMCFHFQNVKGFVSVVFPFLDKHNCKQKSIHSLQIALLMSTVEAVCRRDQN